MTPDTVRLATQRAVLGGGYPYKVRTFGRRADDRGWALTFADVSHPRVPAFRVELDDGLTEDQAAGRILETIQAYQVPDRRR